VFSKGVVKFDNFIRKGKTGEGWREFNENQKLKYQQSFNKHLDGLGLEEYKYGFSRASANEGAYKSKEYMNS
jgi:hypothetical protein